MLLVVVKRGFVFGNERESGDEAPTMQFGDIVTPSRDMEPSLIAEIADRLQARTGAHGYKEKTLVNVADLLEANV